MLCVGDKYDNVWSYTILLYARNNSPKVSNVDTLSNYFLIHFARYNISLRNSDIVLYALKHFKADQFVFEVIE